MTCMTGVKIALFSGTGIKHACILPPAVWGRSKLQYEKACVYKMIFTPNPQIFKCLPRLLFPSKNNTKSI